MALCVTAQAQPTKRRTATQRTGAAASKTEQAKSTTPQGDGVRQFPTAPKTGEDVAWRRDVYRTLDLMEDANAPLYYPVEPVGKQMNLFTYIFRLMLAGQVPAYQFTLDGNENFDAKNRVDVKELLDRYHIYYEEKDGKISVSAQDIPGAEVTRYYVKESATFDQRTSTYQKRITALCPVLMRGADEFDSSATPYPLFWLNYDEVADYLQKLPMMASNYNNVTNMTAGDFFAMNRYSGKIYKTNNLQGRSLNSYCKDDSTMQREQQRIEDELAAFEKGIWNTQRPDTAKVDSIALASAAAKNKVKRPSGSTRRRDAPETRSTKSKESAEAAKSGKASATPRASARRERR